MRASLLVTYRSSQPGFAVINGKTTFWIIPWKIIIAILTVIILAIIISTNKKRASKKNETN